MSDCTRLALSGSPARNSCRRPASRPGRGVELVWEIAPQPVENGATHDLVAPALGRHRYQFPPDEFDPVFLPENAELSQPLELGQGPAQPGHAFGSLCGLAGWAWKFVHTRSV